MAHITMTAYGAEATPRENASHFSWLQNSSSSIATSSIRPAASTGISTQPSPRSVEMTTSASRQAVGDGEQQLQQRNSQAQQSSNVQCCRLDPYRAPCTMHLHILPGPLSLLTKQLSVALVAADCRCKAARSPGNHQCRATRELRQRCTVQVPVDNGALSCFSARQAAGFCLYR